MKCVYLLQSLSRPTKRYTRITIDLDQRLDDHAKADAFETYLKNGSGHAFARRHFW